MCSMRAPFGGRGLGDLFFSGGALGVAGAVPFGIAAGLGSEALRRLVTNSDASQNGSGEARRQAAM